MSKKIDLNAKQSDNNKSYRHHSFSNRKISLTDSVGTPRSTDNVKGDYKERVETVSELKNVTVKFPVIGKVFLVVAIIAVISITFLMTFVSLFTSDEDSSGSGSVYGFSTGNLKTAGYYEPACNKITVVEVDKSNNYFTNFIYI